MSFAVFLLCAAGLALWADAHLGGRRPSAIRPLILHSVVAFAAVEAAVVFTDRLAPLDASPSRQVVAVFGILLPALIYALIASIWLLRTLAAIGARRS